MQGIGGSSSWTLNTNFVDGGENIDKDPIFVTPVNPSNAPTTSGDLRLQSSSPALDARNNEFVTAVTTDLDGAQRIVDGDLDGTPTVDMGAYEFQIEYLYDIFGPSVFRLAVKPGSVYMAVLATAKVNRILYRFIVEGRLMNCICCWLNRASKIQLLLLALPRSLDMQVYADRNQAEVAGLVLLDPSPRAWIKGEGFPELREP